MHYGYNFEEVKQKVFSALSENYAGLSGIELASRTKINRMTLTKYLNLMLAQGLIRKKKLEPLMYGTWTKMLPKLNFQ
ncbi:MAG TPA: helix-turn-helix domain-containing protein [Nitrososphaeraceae archaeon]|jgi:predicted transcriptional regulator|nr:helix-turn-helix domain-containing protein [Nitrososphaeraceae archaeon]